MRFLKDSQLSPYQRFIIAVGVVAASLIPGCGTPHLISLSVTPDRASIALGQTAAFKVTVNYSDGTAEDVTASTSWTSLNPSIATVSASGVASSVAVGAATIEASAKGKSGTASLVISNAALTAISVTSPGSAIALGQSTQLKAQGTYTDKSVEDITDQVRWKAANPDIAAVSTTGFAVSKGIGSTEVTASLNNISANGQITVSAAALASLAVQSKDASTPLGDSEQFSAIGTYTDGSTLDLTSNASWLSSAPGIMTINAAGLGTSKAVGAASISAAVGGISGMTTFKVSPAKLVSIAVSASQSSLPLGSSEQLNAIGTYTDKTTKDITSLVRWTSSSPDVISISSEGVVQAKSIGSAAASAASSNITRSTSLTATTAALVSIAVSASRSSLPLGTSEQLHATGTFTDKTTKDLTGAVRWTSSAPGVFSVSSTGVVQAKSIGSAIVSAAFSNITRSTNLTATTAALVSIAVSASHSSLPLGASEQLHATGTYTDKATKNITASVKWTSYASGVISVSSTGVVQAKSIGAATVSAAFSNITGSTSLTATTAALVSIAVSASHSSLPLGTSEQLRATGTYTDKTTKNITASVAWTSSVPGVISVSSGGVVAAKSVGSATVSAASSNITRSTSLTATAAALVSIAVSASRSSLSLGSSEQLSATGAYTDKSTKNITGLVTWTSSAPGVVSVSSGGVVQAISVGSAAVSAFSANMSGSTNLSVPQPVLVGIDISSGSGNVPVGETLQLKAIGTFMDGSTQDLTGSVSWTSTSPNVLAMRGAGLVAGISVGAAGVTATSGSIAGLTTLNVPPAPLLTSITLAPAGPTVPLGSSLQLIIIGTYSDGSTQDVTSQVTWNIDDPTIAGITPGGTVSGVQVGATGVEASLNGLEASDTLSVQPQVAVNYFDTTSGADSTIRVTNPGTTGQSLCAIVYVFDQDQQMSECCGCLVSQDGLLTLSLKNNLLNNPLTGVESTSGTVMLVPAQQLSSGCDASSVAPVGAVVAWSTHLSQAGTISSAEVPFSSSSLTPTLASSLQAQCYFIQQLGSGQGVCSCGAAAKE